MKIPLESDVTEGAGKEKSLCSSANDFHGSPPGCV